MYTVLFLSVSFLSMILSHLTLNIDVKIQNQNETEGGTTSNLFLPISIQYCFSQLPETMTTAEYPCSHSRS